MNILHASLEGVRDIWSHKFRSSLTILGVVLGVAALMAMFAIVEGMTVEFREQLQESGNLEKMFVRNQDAPPEQAEIAALSPGLTLADAQVLQQAVPGIAWVAPLAFHNPAFFYGNRTDRVRLWGATPAYLHMNKHSVQYGRFLTDLDVENKNRVIVLGARLVENLFDGRAEAAVGASIRVDDIQFRVVGVLPRYLTQRQQRELELGITEEQARRREERGGRERGRGWDPFPWKHNIAVIPITTMQATFKSARMQGGIDQGPEVRLDSIQVGVSDIQQMRVIEEQSRNVLLQTHRGIRDFDIEIRQDQIDQVEQRVHTTRVNGAIIAGIGLVVGGLGITNIMLASIADRIREIGIRRAVGARARDIFIQVMMESLILALIGGILGLMVGNGLVYILDEVARVPTPPILTPGAGVWAMTFAMVTGCFAGLYPALKASLLRPVEALKFD